MNSGIFGFPTGPTVTYRIVEFDTSGTFVASPNCQFVWVEMCGGGGGGQSPAVGAAAGGIGGCAGLYWSGIITARDLGKSATVTIGAGGAAGTDGGTTIITSVDTGRVLMQTSGGRTSTNITFSPIGITATNGFGGGAGQSTSGSHGGPAAGAGGGGHATSGTANPGGQPSSMLFSGTVAARGGGAAAGTGGGSGANASVIVRGFGEGGGGGGRVSGGSAGNGGNGIRGSGGGGAGASTVAAGTGGTGGSGFVRIVEVRFG